MSDLSEAATEHDRAADAVTGVSQPNHGSGGTIETGEHAVEESATAPAASRIRAPFDFSLRLDRDGVRSTDRAATPFESLSTSNPAPLFTPAPAPTRILLEPLEPMEPIVFKLDLSAIPDLVQEAPSMPASFEPSPVSFEPSTTLLSSGPALPILPKPPARVAATDPLTGEPRSASAHGRPVAGPHTATTVRLPAKQKSNKGKALLALVVVFALVAGGVYFIRQRSAAQAKQFPMDLQPLATFVETTLGHPFKKAVSMATLPQAEYEAKLGIFELARVPKDDAGGFSGLRALGLIDTAPTPAAVGEYVGATRTAFYDPETATIYESPRPSRTAARPYYDAKVIGALTSALLDQYKNWGVTLARLSPSQRLGYQALIEGVATYTIRTKTTSDPTFAAAYRQEDTNHLARRDALSSTISPWVLGLLTMDSSTSWAMATRAGHGDWFQALNAPTSDAAVLDSARGLATPLGAPTPDTSTVGMYFWYGVLYPALGSESAFHLAATWSGDSVAYSSSGSTGCIRASIATRDSASLAELVVGLNTWALTRPASTTTTIDGKGTVAVVKACEPTASAPLAGDAEVASHLQGRLVEEQVLLQQMDRFGMPLTDPSVACAVNSYRTDGIVGFEAEIGSITTDPKGTLSATLTKTLQDLALFCGAAR